MHTKYKRKLCLKDLTIDFLFQHATHEGNNVDPNISLQLDFEYILVQHKPSFCAIIFNLSAVHVLDLTASKIIVHQNVKQSMEGQF